MRLQTSGFILLCLYLLIQPGNGNYAEILWGQCYAFCLTRHDARQKQANDDGETIPIPAKSAIKVCKQDRFCKWCMFACDRPRESYHHRDKCLEDCQTSRIRHEEAEQACNDSCWFIWRSSQAKFGECPETSVMGQLGETCVEQCQQDLECDGMNKCCDNGCGKVCHKPAQYDVLPPAPTDLEFKSRKDGGLLVEWKALDKDPIVVKPVIYVLRWWCPYSQSVHHSITTKTRVKLRSHPHGIQPGTSCKFMVASINIKGSQGFTQPQDYFKDLQTPSKPLNLDARSFEGKNGKVDVMIEWHPPHYTDGMNVDRYLVFWSDRHPKESTAISRLHMHKKSVSGDRTSFTVRGLDPATLIFVQVKAVVKWNGVSIRGQPASTFIETYSPPQTYTGAGSSYPHSGMSGSKVYNITVHPPVFLKAKLTAVVTWSVSPGSSVKKYTLFWAPSHCEGESKHRKTRERLGLESESLKQEFRLYNLESDCVYEVKIHTVNFFGEQDAGTTAVFTTPPCDQIEGRTNEIKCPPKVIPPPAPSDLSVWYKFGAGCSCQAVLSWQFSSQDSRSPKLKQFKVVWGHSRPPEGSSASSFFMQSSTIIYNSVPYENILPPDGTSACMTYLEKSTHYTATVVAETAKMKSLPAVIHFVTPEIMDPCYGDNLTKPGRKASGDFHGSVQAPVDTTTTNLTLTQGNASSLPPQLSFLLVCVFSIYATLLVQQGFNIL